MHRRSDAGFTLIELMIVIAIIAVIAAIAIPNLLSAKVASNETAALASLRTLVTSESQIGIATRIDADSDGKGEYGTILEMSGGVGVRKGFAAGTPATCDFSVKGSALNPPVLPASFTTVNAQGYATKTGYAFIIFLPDGTVPAAGFVHEVGPAASVGLAGGTGRIGIDLAETVWCGYAQPMQLTGTGNRRFYANQKGDILQSPNEVARGAGNSTTMNGNSAFTGAGITSAAAIGTTGQDGDLWRVAN